MASRAEQKAQARERRLAEEQAASERTRRQRRLGTVAGTVIIAVVIVAVLVAVSSGSGGSGLKRPGKPQIATVSAVTGLLAGIPQSGAVLGNPKAPTTMTYWGDLECPICAQFTVAGGLGPLIHNEVRAGKVKIIYRNLATASPNPQTFYTQQVAALAAGQQGKFWDYVELFYRQQGQEGSGYVTERFLDTLARQVPGLNFAAWQKARSTTALREQSVNDDNAARQQAIQGTPTVIFRGPTGKMAQPSSGVPAYGDLQASLKQVA